jgi:hypothetical protein
VENQKTTTNTFSLKQKFFLYFYRSQQKLYRFWLGWKSAGTYFADSVSLYLLVFTVVIVVIRKSLEHYGLVVSDADLKDLGFAIAGIIGASIAIIFSFSTFILQSTADLFSTQYLNKFIKDKKEKYIFWALVALTVSSFLIPIFVQQFVVEILIAIMLLAFLLIYLLYKELRTRINPETTLGKIRDDAFFQLENNCKILKKHANIQNRIYEHNDEQKDISLAIQYKSNPAWNVLTLENIKYLYEIGLRLLSKNEINSFNLTLRYIHDVYIKHLSLRYEHIIRLPADFWGTYTFEDEGFSSKILEYFESISDRLIQEKRKENIYYLLSVYENLITNLVHFKYADKNPSAQGENPILNLVLGYYLGLVTKLVQTKERDWIWESIKSVSRVSDITLKVNYSHFNHNQINRTLDEIMRSCLLIEGQEAFLKSLTNISFNQIQIGWEKYSHNHIFWGDLFKTLKKSVIALALSPGINLSINELHMSFHEWLVNLINSIYDLKDVEKQKELIETYTDLLEKWSDYLLDLAREIGLENKHLGLPIIQSVENNLRIIASIRSRHQMDLDKLYKTQFNTLSWYFQNTDKVEESFLFNLEQIQEFLLQVINQNLSEKADSSDVIKLYIRLVQQHFEKVSLGYGYNHPRVIEKLIHLGLIMTKYNHDTTSVVKLIEDLNAKYLLLNKEHFDLKAKVSNLMGPDEYQLCKEIHDLKEDVLSHRGNVLMGIKEFLREGIDEEVWGRFISQIKYCEGVEYTTVRHF